MIGQRIIAIGAMVLCSCSASSPSKPSTSDGGSSADLASTPAGGGLPPYTGAPVNPVTNVQTALPLLPALTNVTGAVVDDSAQVTFDPVDNAVDYRIYPLPADGDVSNAGGTITVHNATYRCAGDLQSPAANSDDNANASVYGVAQSPSITFTQVNSKVGNYTRTTAEATLGYVYPVAGAGLIPVWALGSPQSHADCTYECQWGGWQASRIKTYTSVKATHDTLVAQGYRDDGVAFYVPAPSSATVPVYTASDFSATNDSFYSVLYFTSAAELAAQSAMNPTATDFVVLNAPATGTQPLMRVHYSSFNSAAHDELAVGKTAFNQIYHQGNYPVASLTWSGITQPTTLVIEALSSGCPYQGLISAQHIDSFSDCSVLAGGPQGSCQTGESFLTHEQYSTVDDLRAKSATNGEVFINGQFDVTTSPQAIARTFIQVAPQPPPAMDFYDGFHADQTFAPFSTPVKIPNPSINEGGFTLSNDTYDVEVLNMQSMNTTDGFSPPLLFTAGTFLGQLWLSYADTGSDVQAKFRLEPKAPATLAADSFLHVTMTVDSVSSRRRYPHIIITDQPHFIQETMANGYTVVVEPILTWPSTLQIQFCDHVMWDSNAQCNYYELFHTQDTTSDAALPLPPVLHVPQRSAMDRNNQYDVYLSTSAVYLYFDGTPYGCANLPPNTFKPGAASIAFGDTLYHSGADIAPAPNGSMVDWIYGFSSRHLAYDERRRFESIGYSSGVKAPAWDTGILPCQSSLRNFDTGAVIH